MMKKRLAGVSQRDLERLANASRVTLTEEVVSYIYKSTSRRNPRIHINDVIQTVADNTDVDISHVQDAFDTVYKDHRITIDKDGFVKIINKKAKRSKAFKNVPEGILNPDLWNQISAKEHKSAHASLRTYKKLGGTIDNSVDLQTSLLRKMVSRLSVPFDVFDKTIWIQALYNVNPIDPEYWGKVHIAYKRGGGRYISLTEKKADIEKRPFDITPTIWAVDEDTGYLLKDIAEIQSILVDGIAPEMLEDELISVGASPTLAKNLIEKAIDSPPIT